MSNYSRRPSADIYEYPDDRSDQRTDRRYGTEDWSDEDLESLMELRKLRKQGIYLQLQGNPANPERLVRAGVMRENSNYMREYLPETGDGSVFRTINFEPLERSFYEGNRRNLRPNRFGDRSGIYKGR